MGRADSKASAGAKDLGGNWWEFLKVVIPALLAFLAAWTTSRSSLQGVRLQVDGAKQQADGAKQEAKNAQLATDETKTKLQQSDDATEARLQKSEEKIRDLFFKYNDFTRLREVRGHFDRPGPNSLVGESIPCDGDFEKLSEDFHLWVAVEINGLIFFKQPKATLPEDRKVDKGRWSTTITESAELGREKVFSVRLYAATEEGHYQILNWIASGKYRGIPWMSNTFLVDKVERAASSRQVQALGS